MMQVYLIKVKNLVVKLKLAGNSITITYHIIQTLNCLDYEYNHVVVKVFDQTQLDLPTISTLEIKIQK